MMRAAESALRSLRIMQAARAKAPAEQPAALADTRVPATQPRHDIAAEADDYTLHHRKRAALIRRLGRLPEKLNFGPVPPELVKEIVTGVSPILRSLDPHPGTNSAMAA